MSTNRPGSPYRRTGYVLREVSVPDAVGEYRALTTAHNIWDENRDKRSDSSEARYLATLQRAARDRFSRERGWRTARAEVTVNRLKAGRWIKPDYRSYASVLDHCESFSCGGRPVAILSHSYAPWEECVAFAAGKRCEAYPQILY